MRGRRFIALALATGGLLGASLPAANGADAPGSLRAQAETLRARSATLGDRRRDALLELYALESRRTRAQARVDALRTRLAELAGERQSARTRLRIARTVSKDVQARLAEHVRTLYRNGEPDAIAILLGADSLDAALAGLDGLERSVRQAERVIRQAESAKRRTRALSATLDRRVAEVRRLAAAADETAAALDTALAERRAYVEQLAAEQELARTQIGSLEAEAAAAAARSAQVSSSPAPTPVSAPAPEAASPPPAPVLQPDVVTSGTRTLTVEATGYALTGRTASGLRTGWGIVAVDPSVIPLGTRMTVPGYGEAVAADTGSAVNGLEIDLWFPTTADALAWGRRTVTITLN